MVKHIELLNELYNYPTIEKLNEYVDCSFKGDHFSYGCFGKGKDKYKLFLELYNTNELFNIFVQLTDIRTLQFLYQTKGLEEFAVNIIKDIPFNEQRLHNDMYNYVLRTIDKEIFIKQDYYNCFHNKLMKHMHQNPLLFIKYAKMIINNKKDIKYFVKGELTHFSILHADNNEYLSELIKLPLDEESMKELKFKVFTKRIREGNAG